MFTEWMAMRTSSSLLEPIGEARGGEEGAECLGEDLKHRSDRDADNGTNGANEDGADVMDNAVLSSNDYLQATVNEGDKVLEDWLQAIKLKEASWEDGYLGESIDHTRKTGLFQETLNCEEEQINTETWIETMRMHEASREKECSGEDMSLEQWLEAVKL